MLENLETSVKNIKLLAQSKIQESQVPNLEKYGRECVENFREVWRRRKGVEENIFL